MPLYTKNGDQGQTSLANGQRVSKASPQVDAYGTIDELNSHIGLLIATAGTAAHHPTLLAIQNDLFTIGSIVAGCDCTTPSHKPLEQAIDAITQPWRGFTLPGGCHGAAQAHVCRTVCRRAERLVAALGDSLSPIIVYLNRLSDYLYALALDLNRQNGHEERFWGK